MLGVSRLCVTTKQLPTRPPAPCNEKQRKAKQLRETATNHDKKATWKQSKAKRQQGTTELHDQGNTEHTKNNNASHQQCRANEMQHNTATLRYNPPKTQCKAEPNQIDAEQTRIGASRRDECADDGASHKSVALFTAIIIQNRTNNQGSHRTSPNMHMGAWGQNYHGGRVPH